MTAMQSEIATARRDRTVPRNSPPYNPQSNGGDEKAAQDTTDMTRRFLLGLEARLRCKIPLQSDIVPWMIRHAVFILTRYRIGHNGHTAYRRLIRRNWKGTVAEVGEQVFGRLALKKPSSEKKQKAHKKGKKNLI